MNAPTIKKQARNATVVFSAKMFAQDRTDAELRLVIKTLREVVHTRSGENARESERLIAAAPQLLAACEKLLDLWRRAGPLGSSQMEKIEAAVHMAQVAVDAVSAEDEEDA